MQARTVKISIWITLALAVGLLALGSPSAATVRAQQPTGSIPTVTGTPLGPYITVNLDVDFVNVRSGPSEYFYPKIGILMRGQSAPALGRSPDGSWIQVYYPGVPGDVGWIYAPNVSLFSGGFLSILEQPPTPTPPASPTINPTLAAAYIAPQTPTRLPTFTPAAPVVLPIFTDATSNPSRLPLGLVVFALGFVGIFIAIASFLRGR
jgi:hypothetical protein